MNEAKRNTDVSVYVYGFQGDIEEPCLSVFKHVGSIL